MKFKIIILALFIAVLMPQAVFAQLMESGVPDIKKFDNKNRIRQTVVYIDQTMMKEGKTSWANRIDSKLAASLMPAEHVTVVRLDPVRGGAEEVWSGSWPGYTKEQIQKIKDKGMIGSWFGSNPLDSLDEERRFFRKLFGSALGKIYKAGLKEPHKGKKNVFLALSSDENRIARSGMITRVVIYSDLNGPIDDNLAADFGQAIFYVFGIDSKQQKNAPAWKDAFVQYHGLVGGFESDLAIQNGPPVLLYKYDLSFNTSKSRFLADMVLLVSGDGRLRDSYIAVKSVNPPRASLLTGAFHTSGDGVETLKATTNQGLATDKAKEEVQLSGHDELSGSLGHPECDLPNGDRAVFDLIATPK